MAQCKWMVTFKQQGVATRCLDSPAAAPSGDTLIFLCRGNSFRSLHLGSSGGAGGTQVTSTFHLPSDMTHAGGTGLNPAVEPLGEARSSCQYNVGLRLRVTTCPPPGANLSTLNTVQSSWWFPGVEKTAKARGPRERLGLSVTDSQCFPSLNYWTLMEHHSK